MHEAGFALTSNIRALTKANDTLDQSTLSPRAIKSVIEDCQSPDLLQFYTQLQKLMNRLNVPPTAQEHVKAETECEGAAQAGAAHRKTPQPSVGVKRSSSEDTHAEPDVQVISSRPVFPEGRSNKKTKREEISQ